MSNDFYVPSKNFWQSMGAKLIEKIKIATKAKGIVQIVIVCQAHDNPKRQVFD